MTPQRDWPGTRTWTPAEATAALPLVRRIADDLVGCYARWRAAGDAIELAPAGTAGGAAGGAAGLDAERLMADAQARAAEIDGFREELARLDIRVARVEDGLLAFRSAREPGTLAPLYWAPGFRGPTYDWPDTLPAYGTSTSWPSRAHDVAAKRSRA
ncbi:MAG TPA: DUF2203 family protein [Gemmatimonadaceae bacterium]|nr:DUF2203 family protein [Gemmatimonadaceae bacterium]